MTEEAKRWEGFGTALKPAMELICLARKPLIGTVAENVTRFGTGALNIDGCRVEYLSEADKASATPQGECTAKVGALAGGMRNETERSTFRDRNKRAAGLQAESPKARGVHRTCKVLHPAA